eukprot:CAMPEP_0182431944 /NCGR_PEP_ID=MMETSP1167-20130531/52851_1 /TAXON_ID=2988 /ORGANISM="Mallomonas Sp, Strain CCMP3275" /LENGTH=59 /DNA_ID=CAMNT_0024618875 /DNA_START=1 /DNA_END=177 /DNA_ORIENTATION=-
MTFTYNFTTTLPKINIIKLTNSENLLSNTLDCDTCAKGEDPVEGEGGVDECYYDDKSSS